MERRHCLPLLLLLLPAAVQAKWEGGTAKVVVGQGADDDDDLLKPTFLSDRAARDEHKYLRRKPKCLADAAKQPPMAKRLHQIWWQGASQVPSHFETLRSTWALHHPDWELKVWDQSSITALVEEQYDWFAPVFHALPSRIQQVDAARYIILHSEGGLYADLDIECFKPLDGRLKSLGSALAFFEEPSTHWTAHGTVVSNGMIGAAAGHPMLLRLIRGVTTKSSVFAATGSHMLQRALQECHDAPGLACGCYVTYSSREFFPLHDSMRAPEEFNSLDHHEKHVKAFVQDLSQRKWPPTEAYTAQVHTPPTASALASASRVPRLIPEGPSLPPFLLLLPPPPPPPPPPPSPLPPARGRGVRGRGCAGVGCDGRAVGGKGGACRSRQGAYSCPLSHAPPRSTGPSRGLTPTSVRSSWRVCAPRAGATTRAP